MLKSKLLLFEMVKISIVEKCDESAPRLVSYDDNCDTTKVRDDLERAYGHGLLQRNGSGVLSESLRGNYEYHITGDIFRVHSSRVIISFLHSALSLLVPPQPLSAPTAGENYSPRCSTCNETTHR